MSTLEGSEPLSNTDQYLKTTVNSSISPLEHMILDEMLHVKLVEVFKTPNDCVQENLITKLTD